MEIKHLTTESFDQEVLESPVPVLVDFYADWCNPCKMMAPVMEELAEEKGDALKIVKLNIEEAEAVASRYSVMSIPTLILFRDGEIAHQFVGFKPKAAIVQEFDL